MHLYYRLQAMHCGAIPCQMALEAVSEAWPKLVLTTLSAHILKGRYVKPHLESALQAFSVQLAHYSLHPAQQALAAALQAPHPMQPAFHARRAYTLWQVLAHALTPAPHVPLPPRLFHLPHACSAQLALYPSLQHQGA